MNGVNMKEESWEFGKRDFGRKKKKKTKKGIESEAAKGL